VLPLAFAIGVSVVIASMVVTGALFLLGGVFR
jgi:hypothetical protein